MIAWLRSLAYTVVFYGLTVPIVFIALPIAFSPRLLKPYIHGWAHFHEWCVRWLLGIRLRIEGTLPADHVLVAAKHESAYETITLIRLLHEPVIVLKAELARIPLWGWLATRYGMIPIDRSGTTRALKSMLKAADAARDSGRVIAIFPEGTRVTHGLRPPVRAGFAGLYRHLGLPVVPVALDAGKLWPRNRFVKRPGTITIRFGTPIPSGLPRKEAEARVHEAINMLNPGNPES